MPLSLAPFKTWPPGRHLLGVAALILVAAGIAVGAVGLWYRAQLLPAAPPGAPAVRVEIPSGASGTEIVFLLARKGIIRNPWAFRLFLKLRGSDRGFKAGEYLLSPSLTPTEIARILEEGRVVLYEVTIPEGFTLKQIVARLEKAGLINPERFWKVAATAPFDYDFLKDGPPGAQRLEGFLFPDTYFFSKGMSEEDIIGVMLRRFTQVFTPDMEARARELSLTTRQVITLASLVEREAKKDEERPLIAAVFHNRLRRGLKLESCATVQYLLEEPKPVLRQEDLKIPSPYNTYLYPGLPPGPIASPGLASIKAALYPAAVPYLYFVVGPDGSHIFSRTLEGHLQASRAVRRRP